MKQFKGRGSTNVGLTIDQCSENGSKVLSSDETSISTKHTGHWAHDDRFSGSRGNPKASRRKRSPSWGASRRRRSRSPRRKAARRSRSSSSSSSRSSQWQSSPSGHSSSLRSSSAPFGPEPRRRNRTSSPIPPPHADSSPLKMIEHRPVNENSDRADEEHVSPHPTPHPVPLSPKTQKWVNDALDLSRPLALTVAALNNSADGHNIVPTTKLVLWNMLSEDQPHTETEYTDLMEDISSKVDTFGRVTQLTIPRPAQRHAHLLKLLGDSDTAFEDKPKFLKHNHHLADSSRPCVGYVVVEYERAKSAYAAMLALSGLQFQGRTVLTSFLPLDP
eukprot:NODE_2734_length_1107_cov_23.695918_g2609_i0.p1 GENE.NODE_2734_length_1107_cov_23.695918_g2609_i0~~NODE_2734_length_1107_cov_23.695918_g2609_i0.p1  ORF type:complete len:332 (-),score=1.83 NODE_2734_length_1107_cov_23.695918_g2609_i0:57-1052(-)